MNLDAKLSDWQKQKLITQSQKEAILEYENQVKKPLLFYSLLFLSSFCICIGIIALIAANWENISPLVKLICDYALLSSAAVGLFFSKRSNKPYIYDGLIIAYALLILATIGLVGQIYNLPSQGLQAILFWSLLTFPLIFLSNKPLFPGLWMLGFTLSISDFLIQIPQFRTRIEILFNPIPSLGFCVTLTVLYFMWQGLNLTKQKPILTAFQNWIITVFCIFAAWTDIIGNDFEWNDFATLNSLQGQVYGIALMAFLALWKLSSVKHTSPTFVCLSILYGYTLLANLLPNMENILSAVMIIALLIVVGIYAYQNHQERLFKMISILLALRFFGIYCEVFGSLLTTGLGLIISGIIFLSIAWYGRKLSTHFLQSMKGKTNA